MTNIKKELSHLSEKDLPRMVDVSKKSKTIRIAKAVSKIYLGKELAEFLNKTKSTKKGPVFQTAVIAGIQGAKKTSELIPMCHPLPLDSVEIEINTKGEYVLLFATVKTKLKSADLFSFEVGVPTQMNIMSENFTALLKS